MKAKMIALLGWLALSATALLAENATATLNTARAEYRTDRKTFVQENLNLTEAEAAKFWPLYDSYRADMEKIGDGLIKLVLEYADAYPNVDEARAQELLKQYLELEEKLVSKRAWYLKRAKLMLPATKVLRWAQLENRQDAQLRLQMAGAIPLMPAVK